MNPALIDFTTCKHHPWHTTQFIDVDLALHKLKDVAPIPEHLAVDLHLWVYKWADYSDDKFDRYDFCPGQDAVSYCLDQQGIWEPHETMAVLDILTGWSGRGLVVDVGSQIGYYPAIAAKLGCNTISVEAFEQSAQMTNANAAGNNKGRGWHESRLGMIQVLPVEPARNTRLFIADVEGQEAAAVDWYSASFEAGLVDYALLEFSPVFNDTYPALLERLNGWGYEGRVIPPKGSDRRFEYASEPLVVLRDQPPITVDDFDFPQENVLFHYTAR